MTVKDVLKAAADIVLPRYCAVCGRKLVLNEEQLCLECAMKMPLTYFWTERINPMADKLNARLADSVVFTGSKCVSAETLTSRASGNPSAKVTRERYFHAMALFFYKGKYRALTKSVKYNCNLALGRYLGEALGRKVALCEWMKDVDMVIPVPLHRLRKLVRGYNQALVIAQGITEELSARNGQNGNGQNGNAQNGNGQNGNGQNGLEPSWPLTARTATFLPKTDILIRSRRTKSQARLRMAQKSANVAGAFAIKKENLAHCPRHVLLIDDVFTSGATLSECVKALRLALVEKFGEEGHRTTISVATLAYVGD